MNYTLQQLRAFVTVVELKNLRKSAEKLFLSPPALTKQLQNLEDILGFKLFDRKNNRLNLNDKGQALYAMLEPVLAQIDKINHIAIPSLKAKKPSLRIALSHIFEQSLFYKINQLVHKEPLFGYDLVISNKDMVIQYLLKYEVDVIVVVLKQDEIENLERQGFVVNYYYDISFDAYVSKKSILVGNVATELKPLKLILQSEHKNKFPLVDTINFSSYVTIFNAIRQGIGYGFLPTVLLTEEEKNELLNINHELDQRISKVKSYYVYLDKTPKTEDIQRIFISK